MPVGFTTVNNEFLRDANISLATRGLLMTMLSLPDGWNMSGKGLAAILPDGRDKVFSTLKILEEKGYLRRVRVREGGCFVDVEYQFCDSPIFLQDALSNANSDTLLSKRQSEKRKQAYRAKKASETITEDLIFNIASISPKAEEADANTFIKLCGDERRKYVQNEVLEKDKAIEAGAPESYFEVITDVFCNLCDENTEIIPKLMQYSAYDVLAICEKIQKEPKKDKMQRIVRCHLLSSEPFNIS